MCHIVQFGVMNPLIPVTFSTGDHSQINMLQFQPKQSQIMKTLFRRCSKHKFLMPDYNTGLCPGSMLEKVTPRGSSIKSAKFFRNLKCLNLSYIVAKIIVDKET